MTDGLEKWQYLAEEGNAEAQYQLGILYLRGEGGARQSHALAFGHFQKAAKQDHIDAQHQLVNLYANGQGVAQNDTLAKFCREKATQSAHSQPPQNLSTETTTANIWKRAEASDAAAQYELGMLYAAGKEVEKDEAEAVQCFLASAEQGYVKAQYALGLSYAHGRGVAQNNAEAVKWLKKASENGYKPADTLLQKMGYGKQ